MMVDGVMMMQDPEKMKEGTAALSRNHVIEVSQSKLVTVTGGKWTTYRRMAQDTVDRLLKARRRRSSSTGRHRERERERAFSGWGRSTMPDRCLLLPPRACMSWLVVVQEKPELLSDGFVSPTARTWNMKLLGADRAGIVCDQKFNKIGVTLRNVRQQPGTSYQLVTPPWQAPPVRRR